MMARTLSVLVIGQGSAPAALDERALAGAAQVEFAADLRAATDRLQNRAAPPDVAPPDIIVLVEPRPGSFATAGIDRLRRLAPLARFWRVMGSWCEGDSRTGKPPAGCVHTYWHQWAARSAVQFSGNNDAQAVGLPQTATLAERMLAIAEEPLPVGAGLIVIHARHAQTAAMLVDACQAGGYATHVFKAGHDPLADAAWAAVWDAPLEEIGRRATVESLRRRVPGAPLLALVSFPREHDCLAAAEAGVAGVISKPFLLHDFLWQLGQLEPAKTG